MLLRCWEKNFGATIKDDEKKLGLQRINVENFKTWQQEAGFRVLEGERLGSKKKKVNF